MKKIIIPTLCVIILCGYLYYRDNHKEPFRCDAQVITHIDNGDSKAEVNLYANIIFSLKNEGETSLTGTIIKDGKEYRVSKTIFFTLQPSELEGVNKTKIIREQINKNHEVPESIWQQLVLPYAPGVVFNSELKRLNKNAMFLEELSNPLFVCTKIG